MRVILLTMWLMMSAHGARVLLTVGADGEFPSQRFPDSSSKTIDLDVDGASLQAVVESIVSQVGVEILIADGVRGTVTTRLQDAPWETALVGILESQGLRLRNYGPVWVIEPSQ